MPEKELLVHIKQVAEHPTVCLDVVIKKEILHQLGKNPTIQLVTLPNTADI
jgi:hypothetical protein